MVAITLTLLIIFTLLLFFQFLGYPLLMARFYKNNKKTAKDYSFEPFVSIIVPTYNEEKVIVGRINNLLSQNYPSDKFEIIIVDSDSKDNTLILAKELGEKHTNVKVVEEGERRGKASAINLGKRVAKGEIVLVTDANDVFNDNALREIVPHFKNLRIGAVGGYFILTNSSNELVSASSFYWDIESLMRRGESVFDSACTFHGEINAWRKDIIDADPGSLTEDLDMAIRIRKRGFKIVYEPNAIAYEAGPSNAKEQIIQKKRTTLGTIQSFFKFKSYLWFPRDKYSGLIYPSHKTLQIFSPFLLIGVITTLLFSLVLQELIASMIYILITGALFLISLFILNQALTDIKATNTQRSDRTSSNHIFNILKYVLLHELIILLAWKDYILKRYSVTWQKAETTRISNVQNLTFVNKS